MSAFKAVLSEVSPVTVTGISGNFLSLSGQVRVAIYSDNGSGTAPNALLMQSGLLNPTASSGLQHFDIPDTVLSPGTYWLAFQSSAFCSMDYNDGSSLNWASHTVAFGLFPSTFSTLDYSGNVIPAFWADYCSP